MPISPEVQLKRLAAGFLTIIVSTAIAAGVTLADAGQWGIEIQAGDTALERGDYSEAELHYRGGLLDAEKADASSEEIATILELLAIALLKQRKTWSAEQQLTRALALREHAQSVEHPDFATTLVQRAKTRMGRHRYDDAHADLIRALTIREGSGPLADEAVVEVLTMLVDVYRYRGLYHVEDTLAGALADTKQAKMRERDLTFSSWSNWLTALEAEDPGLSRSMTGDIYTKDRVSGTDESLGRFVSELGEASGEWGSAGDGRTSLQGPEERHRTPSYDVTTRPDTGTKGREVPFYWWLSLVWLVPALLWVWRKFPGSRIREAMKIGEHGIALLSQGDLDGARQALQMASDMLKEAGVPDHLRRAKFLDALAVVHMRNGHLADADRVLIEAVKICELILSTERLPISDLERVMSSALMNAANVKEILGHFDESESHLRLLIRVKELRYPSEGPEIGVAHYLLGRNLHQQGKFTESSDEYLDAFNCVAGQYAIEQVPLAHGAASLALDLSSTGDYRGADELLGQAERLCDALDDSAGLDLARTLYVLGVAQAAQQPVEKADPMLRRAMKILEAIQGRTHPETASVISQLGYVEMLQGRLDRATQLQREALECRERSLGSAHPETIKSLCSLIDLSRRKGRLAEAEGLLEQGLKSALEMSRTRDPNVASSLCQLAFACQFLARFKDAERLLKEALNIQREVQMADHPLIAQSLAALAMLYLVLGHADRAESLASEAVTMLERTLDETNVLIAGVRGVFAEVLVARGRYREADRLLRTVLESLSRLGPASGSQIASFQHSLARLWLALGRITDAEQLVDASERRLVSDAASDDIHLSGIDAIRSELARAHGDLNEAYKYARRVLDARERMLGPGHPDRAVALQSMAVIELERGDYDEAEEHAGEALRIFDNIFGTEHPHVAACLGILVGVHAHTGKLAEGRKISERALSILEQNLDAMRPGLITAVENLALLHQQIGDIEGAAMLYERAIQDAERAYGLDHPDLVGPLERYAVLLDSIGRNDEARKLTVQASAIREICGRSAP